MLQLLQIRSIQFVGLTIALLLMITLTSPESVGASGIVGFFGLLYAWSFVGIKLASGVLRSKEYSLPFDDRHFFPNAVLAGYLPAVLGLASINQFSWRDGAIVAGAFFVAIFYWARRFK